MRELLMEEVFSDVRSTLSSAGEAMATSSDAILLHAPPTLLGALAIAPIEAALLDSEIPYRRRFRSEAPKAPPFVHVLGPEYSSGPVLESSPMRLTISTTVVEGLRGHHGDARKGPLTTVPQAHALAQSIFPESSRMRRMRPWLISGNWLDSALDTTYDPVYTALRDLLLSEGSIRVVPIPEVGSPDSRNSPWLDDDALEAISKQWDMMDLEAKARALSNLAKPALTSSTPSSARLEELMWHCVLGNDWSTDLATQIRKASSYWEGEPAHIAAGTVVDSLLREGQC
ncbi:MAG: hypothetical protein QF760_00120 [Candidatus Thalassarchaeaceae archaeon]|jgi:hypothetical protein|nr:hypothetical protein [Candidatus Thalassarchaeaceae archaeon]MDP7004302.1 hypothetical protein [Candidatus Thalassarchaeaceae archaeon]